METKAGTIVVGVDGSESSARALAWATEQAVAEHRPLTLVHAIHAVSPAYLDTAMVDPADASATMTAAGRTVLRTAHATVEAVAPDLEVHEVFDFVDPRELLLEQSRNATMVVLGSRGLGKVRSLLLGSVGLALVRHAHSPVVVLRPGNPGTVRNGVIVGVETSAESQPVLEFAYREASLRELPLTVLHCYWDIQAGTAAGGLVYDSIADMESEWLALAETMAGMAEKYPDVSVTTRMARGLPHQTLVELGERMNLVVVGAHQANRVLQMMTGSVSVALVEHATCPVAVVPVTTPR